jgi:hypothetical protein
VRTIVVPAAWKTASNEAVKFGPRARSRNLMSANRSLRARVAGLLHGPLASGVRGDAAKVHPAAAVLDEHQHVQSLQQHGARVQEGRP